MPTVGEKTMREHRQYIKEMDTERLPWTSLWKECSDNYLPQRYRWLMTAKEFYANRARRQYIINNTGTQAARTLAAGMMNGITSPSRPWFKLRIPGISIEEDSNRPVAIWLEEVERRMLKVLAESNFYNSMSIIYLDMAVFGSAASLIYEDTKSVIRCYNPPLGEFYFAQSARGDINIFARKFHMKVYQYVERWPDRSTWSDFVKNAVEQGGALLNKEVEICHFIGPNLKQIVPSKFDYYELYWESRRAVDGAGTVLEKRGFYELPGIFARWELSGNDAYGVSPGMDALGDNIELQHLHREKASLLEKMNKPPLLVDISLQNQPKGFIPNGQTYVNNLNNNVGVKPIYTVNPNFAELNQDKLTIEQRIRDTFFNFLFTGVTNLNTVRSATEIEVRESEKLILLGGVLERFESEALDPAISRVFSIMDRAGLLPAPPPGLEDVALEIQYVSVLSVAQRAFGTAPTERLLALVGNMAAVIPGVLDIPDFDRILVNYARDIGIRESEIKAMEQVLGERQQRQTAEMEQQALAAAPGLAQGAKNLSETDVGGGANALQQLLGV